VNVRIGDVNVRIGDVNVRISDVNVRSDNLDVCPQNGTLNRLLLMQRLHRRDARRAQGGHGRGEECRQYQQRHYAEEGQRIAVPDAEEKRLQEPAEQERSDDSRGGGNAHHAPSLRQDEAEQACARRAEGQAKAELARAAGNQQRQHAVHPNHRQRHRDERKRGEAGEDERTPRLGVAHELGEAADAIERDVGIEAAHDIAQRNRAARGPRDARHIGRGVETDRFAEVHVTGSRLYYHSSVAERFEATTTVRRPRVVLMWTAIGFMVVLFAASVFLRGFIGKEWAPLMQAPWWVLGPLIAAIQRRPKIETLHVEASPDGVRLGEKLLPRAKLKSALLRREADKTFVLLRGTGAWGTSADVAVKDDDEADRLCSALGLDAKSTVAEFTMQRQRNAS